MSKAPSDETAAAPDYGDTPISLLDPLLTHGEAVEITGVPSKTLNNWTQREVIDLGTMHRTGRRLYSIIDLIKLKIVGDLAQMVLVPPTFAAAIAGNAHDRAMEMTERDALGRPKYKGGAKEVRQYLICWIVGDNLSVNRMKGVDWLAKYSHAHSTIVVPLDDIVTEIMNKSFDVLEREHKKDTGAE